MATIILYQPPSVAAKAKPKPKPAAPKAPPPQRKASIATASGRRIVLPFAPNGVTVDGWADSFTTLDRPGRSPLVVRTGDGLPSLSFDVILARRSLESPVEDYLDQLRSVAASGERLAIAGLSKYEAGPWRLTGCQVTLEQRQAGTNRISRATASLTFLAAVDPVTKVGPISGGAVKPKPKPKGGSSKKPGAAPAKSTRYHTVKRGETLWSIADRYYGRPTEWPRIAKASKLTSANRLRVGQRLTIPPRT